MKFLGFIVLFVSLSGHAAGSFESLTSFDKVENPDNSVTFTNIEVLKGDKSFAIGHFNSEDYTSACKRLGYENYLAGVEFNSTTYKRKGWKVATLADDGDILSTTELSNKISKLTCFNEKELKQLTNFDKKINPDGSVTFNNISVLVGDQEIGIWYYDMSDVKATCNRLGFSDFLDGTDFNEAEYNPKARVLSSLFDDGKYNDSLEMNNKIWKVTCINPKSPSTI